MDANLRERLEEGTGWIVTEVPGETGGTKVASNGATGTTEPTAKRYHHSHGTINPLHESGGKECRQWAQDSQNQNERDEVRRQTIPWDVF